MEPTSPPSSRAAPVRSAPSKAHCATCSDGPALEPDGKWDGSTCRISVNARLFDDFGAALAARIVIDGKHLWKLQPLQGQA